MNCGTEEYGWICLVQDREKCWAVVHTAMNLPVLYLLTGCGAVGFSRSTLLHSVCCLLYVLVRRTVYSLCVVCFTGLCSHGASLQHLQTSAQPTAHWYRYKLYVISPYNCQCRPPHNKIFRVFCEVEHRHAQTHDAPCHLNRSFAHDRVLK